jgi:hypothetical protein
VPGQPFKTGGGIVPARQALSRRGQPGQGRRIRETGVFGDQLSSLFVDDGAVGVPAHALVDTLPLPLTVPLPQSEQFVDARLVGRGHRFADSRAKSARFVDEGAEDVEDDDLDVADRGHRGARSRRRHLLDR